MRICPRGTRLKVVTAAILLALVGPALIAPVSSSAAKADDPTAEEILELVRYSYALKKSSLTGLVRRTGRDGRIEAPFDLSLNDSTIRFWFKNPNQVIHLELNDEGCLLKEVVAGSDAPIPPKRYGEAIRGTDMNFEDLSLRFLYWGDSRVIREEKYKSLKVWLVRVRNPRREGPYGTVDLWIARKSGAIVKMQAYNWGAKLVKRYMVISGQKIDGAWVLKEMRVETISPTSGKPVSMTYLFIKGKKE